VPTPAPTAAPDSVSTPEAPASIAAEYFDGRSARARPVRLSWAGGELRITGDRIALAVAARDVSWPERTRHGTRVAHLPGGGAVHCHDSPAWDAWARAAGQGDSWVVRTQQSWRAVLVSAAALAVLVTALFGWGIPWLGRSAVAATPLSVDRAIGESALQALDEDLLLPSSLPADQQQRIAAAFARAVARLTPGDAPQHCLMFRSGRLGANAFALPGGTLVLTDGLVSLVRGDESVLIGVLGHELGHVKHRHGLRLLVQAGVIGALSSLVLGDFSMLLAGAPTVLGQASYSRDAEREADEHAVRVLRAAGLSPAVMVEFFEKAADRRGRQAPTNAGAGRASTPAAADRPAWGIAFASHPANEARIQFFRDAAASGPYGFRR
jgi:predicted Zn-dependent protease